MKKNYEVLYFILILLIVFTIPTFVSANDNMTDKSILSSNNNLNSIVGDNYYSDGELQDDVQKHGIYYGPYSEPAIIINKFEINACTENINNNVSINVTFDGIIKSNIFTLDRYPLTIKENNKVIGKITPQMVSNTDYPTDQKTPYKFTASFNYTLKNYTSHVKLRLCGFESNLLIFKYNENLHLSPINENIIIYNKGNTIKSDHNWLNNIESLEKAIYLADENATILLNNISLFGTKKIVINKNINIIGNNTKINALGLENLFEINSKVNFTNIEFTNGNDYIFINNNDLILNNCLFTNTNPKIINNTANLKIIKSEFKNINGILTSAESSFGDLINNLGSLELNKCKFYNIKIPYQINSDTPHIIFNSYNSLLKINNTIFNNISGEIINNHGKINISKSNISNIFLSPSLLEITKINKPLNDNITLISSYIETWTPETMIGPISNFNELNIINSIIENNTWNGMKGIYYISSDDAQYNWFMITDPYYKISGFYIDTSSTFLNKAGAIYNRGKINIKNTIFKNLKATNSGSIENEGTLTIDNTTFTNSQSERDGGAITNKKTLNINNSIFNNTGASGKYYGNGGAIYNTGNTTINHSNFTYCNGAYGQAIYNKGNIDVNNSIFDNTKDSSTMNFNGGVLYNIEEANFTIYNSIIKNTRFKQASTWPTTYYGVVINAGNMNITRTIFDNNTPVSPQNIIGTFNLYNMGKMNATYNIFTNTMKSQSQTTHVYAMSTGDGQLYMNHNYFDYNKDPYKIHTNIDVNQYFVLSLEPDYLALNINDTTTLNVYLKLDNGKFYTDYSKLPEMNITININGTNITKTLINGKASININNTKNKGTYYVTAHYGDWSQTVQIDIGKANSRLQFEAEEINYGDDATFNMTVTGNYTHQPEGNITIIIDGKEYTTKIKDTKANFTISGLIPKTYDLIIRYEGDNDYFKAIHHQNYTVHKKPTQMNITILEIYYGETGIINVNLTPKGFSTQAYMYITDETNKTTRKTVYVRDSEKLELKNYAAGEYNITIVTWENSKYESSNATATFKVNKFPTNLTINASDIDVGETEILNITLRPKGEVAGEAILQINNHTQIIFLKNGENNIILENLTGGSYNVTVTFQGDKKYAQSSASTRFTVKKLQTNITAKIEDNILYINTTPNSTGKVQIFINDDIYEVNLTESSVTFPINFTKAENYIFIYYQGDGYYNYTTCNLTYEYEELLNLTGYDETFYNTENATYYLTLTDEEGYGIADRTIILKINNDIFEYITGNDGSITVPLNPTVGEYEITAQYRNRTAKNTVKILEDAFITGNDTQSYTNVDFTYAVELKDHLGKAIADVEITFEINGKTYKNKTDYKGLATITLNLPQGNYNITATYNTVNYSNKIYVGDILLKGNDLTFYNTENGTYELSLIDKNGKGVANQTITITLNGNTYTKTTDENGKASLNINLDTGNYKITAQFNDQKITNKITVLEDAFLSVNNTKAYENVDFTHIAKLTDHNGKGIANAEITFKINGKTYTNKTNDKGLAVLTLNLKEGNYTITSTYKNITKTAKIIIVDDSHLVGNDVKAYSGIDFKYNVKLTDHNNKGIADAEITFKINGKTYTNKTNVNGETTLTFNLETGNYTIITSYKNHTIENNFEIIEDYILSGNDVKAYADTDFIYKVRLTDHNAKAIKNQEITFALNGKTYTNKTDINGQAIICLNLKTGNYTITVRYRNTTTTNALIIIEDYILNGNDIKAFAEDDFTYKVNLTDHNGKAIKNAEITFEIDGKTYTNKTDEKGLAEITLNLKEGNYTITAKYKNTTAANELEIIEDHMMIGQNIKAYENTDFTYTITLKRTDGTPLTNKEITFIINNKRYTNTTNNEGKASKTLNLPEGNYTITAIYKNTRITNNLTIIEEYNLEGNNIRAHAEKDFAYKINLTDHNKKAVKNGEITFEINGQIIKNRTDANGQAILTLNLKKGNYTITATYKNIKTTNKLEIVETYTLKGINVKSYENFDFEYIVTLKNHNDKAIENAEITFEINGQIIKNKTDANGKAKLTLNLKKGNYTIKASYNNISTTNKLEIIEYDLERIISEDVEMFYHDGTRFKIQLLNQTTPLANKTVQIIINGIPYTRTTDENGSASIGLNLNSGRYTVTTKYGILEKNNTLTIKSTIKGKDITKVFKNSTQYYATFYNSKGEILKNTDVTFNINGVFYTRTTNENGTAKMNINLPQGTYIITATNPQTQEQHTNIITVLSKIQENNDLTKYYRNASQYTLKIIDEKGNPAKAGQKVTFNINGVFYERYTNETGYVKMNINLPPGTYIITAEYDGCRVSNTIKVLPVLKAQDLTMKYRDGSKFKVTLVDGKGKAYANQEVTFNINGVFYTRNTNENGIAQLNINLMPGKYIITSSYNGANIANTVKIE